jgi:TorA maturation chaperone TorD
MFASLALQPPDEARIAEMTLLVPTLPEPLCETATKISAFPAADWEPEFFSVLGPGACGASESGYARAAMASRGPLLTEVAGYYSAFAYPGDRLREVPDHIAVETGFLSFLAMKVAFARFAGRAEEEAVAREAYDGFLHAHVESWVGDLCDALAESGSDHYAAIAMCLRRVVAAAGGRP